MKTQSSRKSAGPEQSPARAGRPSPEDRLTEFELLGQTQQRLQERVALLELVAEIARSFVKAPPGEVGADIDRALQRVGEFFEADATRLGYVTLDGRILPTARAWFSDHLDADKLAPIIFEGSYPNLAKALVERECLAMSSVNEFAEWGGEAELDFVRKTGVKAAIIVSLGVGAENIETFAIEMMRSERTWSRDAVECVQLIARILSNSARRASAEEELLRSLAQARESEENLGQALAENESLRDRLEAENIYLQKRHELTHGHHEILGESEVMRKMLAAAEQVAVTDSTVLILGETGTGKELLARWIHRLSARGRRVMVEVNCAGLPVTLVESELFGREKGAYTGALAHQKGRFDIADGSTIFLDEIGELPLELQTKLLRVLQEGRFERLGSPKTLQVDVRVIAATNRDLAEALREGRFREDLYYRLNVFPITVPPLRERREDIPLLVWAFVGELGKSMGKSIDRIPRREMQALEAYDWPGNVRELRNVIERALILSTEGVLQFELPELSGSQADPALSFEEVQRRHILATLKHCDWRVRGKDGAADVLGLKPTTLEFKMKKLGVTRPDGR